MNKIPVVNHYIVQEKDENIITIRYVSIDMWKHPPVSTIRSGHCLPRKHTIKKHHFAWNTTSTNYKKTPSPQNVGTAT
jgi:hypothetical protein